MKKKGLLICIGYMFLHAVTAEEEFSARFWQSLKDSLSYRLYMQSFGVLQQPADSLLNVNNRFKIPRYTLAEDIRPELYFNSSTLDVALKPRMELRAKQWEDGFAKGQSQTDIDFFIYEGLITLNFNNKVFASYGRENLQWGPSVLLSPSNPFNPNNNRNNPVTEMQGMDYAKLIWVPSYNFSASFIANTDAGRVELFGRKFNNTYALKLDYTGDQYYVSLIPSYQHSDEKAKLGYLGQWNLTDAILLYSEGSVLEHKGDFSMLFGTSYTFYMGGTVALEYFHHENGCDLDQVSACYTPLYNDNPIGTFIRKDYLQFQYYDVEIFDSIDLVFRWTHGLNDHSNFAVSYLQYQLNDHIQLFSVFSGGIGSEEDELSGFLDYSITLGAGYTF